MTPGRKRRASVWGPGIVIGLWIVIMFWRIATLQAVNIQDDIFTSDLLNDRLPVRAFVGATIARGEPPLWISGIYTGFPALAQVEIGALYPTNLLLFGSLPPYVAIAYAQLLPLLMVGLGTALLALQYGLPAPPAILAGGAMALSGFFVCHIRQLNLIDTAGWFPWLLLFVERSVAMGTSRPSVLLAGCWALSLLAGHPQVSYYGALVLVPYFVTRSLQSDRARGLEWSAAVRNLGGHRVVRFFAALAIGMLVAAATLIPAAELNSLGLRAGGISWEMASAFPVSPRSLWSFVLPYADGDASDASFRLSGIFWEQYGYLGLLPALLALFAVVVERRDGRVVLLAGIGLVSASLMLGPNTPLFGIAFATVPGMSYFRFPARFLLFVELAVALLAAFGLAHLMRSFRHRAWGAGLAAVVLAATAADLWIHQRRQVPLADWSEWTKSIETVDILRRAGAVSNGRWRIHTLESRGLHTQIFHLSKGWAGDLSHYLAGRDLLQPSANLLHELETPDGYANLVPRHYEAVWGSEKLGGLASPSGELTPEGWRTRPAFERLLRLFNVRWVLAAWPLASPAFRRIGASHEGVGVYEIRDPMPRAYVVGRARPVESDGLALAILDRGEFDPDEEALVHDEIALPAEARSSRSVRVVERTTTSLRIDADLAAPGLLVLSEGYYPGWRATVDGVEAQIVRANMMMRSLVLPAGRHEVIFEFRSAAVRLGATLSGAGLVALLGAWIFWRRSD